MIVSNVNIFGVFGCKWKYINKKIICYNEVKKYIVNIGIYFEMKEFLLKLEFE